MEIMISLKNFTSLPAVQRKFMSEYLDMINSFQFKIETYRVKQDNLAIQNTDLWIESYIDIVPELHEFRELVRNEMDRLKIDRHPDFAYKKEYNHYYYSNKREIEELRNSIKSLSTNDVNRISKIKN